MNMVRTHLFLAVLIFIAICFSGCTTGFFSLPSAELTKNKWMLVSYNDGEGNFVQVGRDNPITLNFYENGQINGTVGNCTRYSGTYTASGELLTTSNITERLVPGCNGPSEGTGQEEAYLPLLRNATRFNVDENGLSLSYYDVTKLLIFVPV
jgi:heat shock protein HslJ